MVTLVILYVSEISSAGFQFCATLDSLHSSTPRRKPRVARRSKPRDDFLRKNPHSSPKSKFRVDEREAPEARAGGQLRRTQVSEGACGDVTFQIVSDSPPPPQHPPLCNLTYIRSVCLSGPLVNICSPSCLFCYLANFTNIFHCVDGKCSSHSYLQYQYGTDRNT